MLCPQKLSNVSFTNPAPSVAVELQLLKLMFRCVNDGVTTINPGHQTTEKARFIWLEKSPFNFFPKSGRVYVWRTRKEVYNPECLPSSNSEAHPVIALAAMSWFSVGIIITIHVRITAREYVDRLGNQVHPMIQTLFPRMTMTAFT
jgi:hypothetical protein